MASRQINWIFIPGFGKNSRSESLVVEVVGSPNGEAHEQVPMMN